MQINTGVYIKEEKISEMAFALTVFGIAYRGPHLRLQLVSANPKTLWLDTGCTATIFKS